VSENNDTLDTVLKISAIVSLVLVGIAFFIAALNLRPQEPAAFVGIAFQLLFAIIALAFSALICVYTYMWVESKVSERQEVRQKAPALGATLLLLGNVVLIVADKSFDGDDVATVVVSLSLLTVFWISNYLVDLDKTHTKIIGTILWLLSALVYLPVAVMVHRGWSVSEFFSYLMSFDIGTKIFFGVTWIALILLPFSFRPRIRTT
jgi:hypothetical protein